MLQLRMLSGEAVTSIPVEEIQDVKGLKQRLTDLHGLPPDLGRGFSSTASH